MVNSNEEIPDYIQTAVTAFHHFPPVWCGEKPSEKEWKTAPLPVLIKDVYKKELSNGLKIRVRRDGLFAFDFTNTSEAPETTIPGYTSSPGKKIPREVGKAEELAEQRAFYRNAIMNVYQTCICIADRKLYRRHRPLGAFIGHDKVIELNILENNNLGHMARESTYWPYSRHLAAITELEVGRRRPEFKDRTLLEQDLVECSFIELEKIITHSYQDLSLLVYLLYQAAIRFSENMFPDSLILSWSVCERLLGKAWDDYLCDRKSGQADEARINKERYKKLKGRDFTASVINENLELAGIIPTDVYKDVDAVRKIRNERLHQLKDVSSSEASHAVRATEKLLKIITGLQMDLTLQRTGAGGGFIPKKMWEDYKKGLKESA